MTEDVKTEDTDDTVGVGVNKEEDKVAAGSTLTAEKAEEMLNNAEQLMEADLKLEATASPDVVLLVVKFLSELALTYGFLGKCAGVDKDGTPMPKFHCSLAQSYKYRDRAGNERRVLPLYAVCYNLHVNYGVVAKALHHVLFGGYEGDLRIDTQGIDLSDPRTAEETIRTYLRHVWRRRVLTGKAGAGLDEVGSISLRDSHFAARVVGSSSKGIGRDIPSLLLDDEAVTYEALLALQQADNK